MKPASASALKGPWPFGVGLSARSALAFAVLAVGPAFALSLACAEGPGASSVSEIFEGLYRLPEAAEFGGCGSLASSVVGDSEEFSRVLASVAPSEKEAFERLRVDFASESLVLLRYPGEVGSELELASASRSDAYGSVTLALGFAGRGAGSARERCLPIVVDNALVDMVVFSVDGEPRVAAKLSEHARRRSWPAEEDAAGAYRLLAEPDGLESTCGVPSTVLLEDREELTRLSSAPSRTELLRTMDFEREALLLLRYESPDSRERARLASPKRYAQLPGREGPHSTLAFSLEVQRLATPEATTGAGVDFCMPIAVSREHARDVVVNVDGRVVFGAKLNPELLTEAGAQ